MESEGDQGGREWLTDMIPAMWRDPNRPWSVTIVSWVYIAAGVMGLVYHLADFKGPHGSLYGLVAIELVRLLAIIAGVFMLRGANWARGLALAWMAFHVAISYLNGWRPVVVHAALLVVIAFFLLRLPANDYFTREAG